MLLIGRLLRSITRTFKFTSSVSILMISSGVGTGVAAGLTAAGVGVGVAACRARSGWVVWALLRVRPKKAQVRAMQKADDRITKFLILIFSLNDQLSCFFV
jgi:hypothetical protein